MILRQTFDGRGAVVGAGSTLPFTTTFARENNVRRTEINLPQQENTSTGTRSTNASTQVRSLPGVEASLQGREIVLTGHNQDEVKIRHEDLVLDIESGVVPGHNLELQAMAPGTERLEKAT